MNKMMETLPEEIFIYLSNFLSGRDCVSLSHASSRFLNLYKSESFWRRIFTRESLVRNDSVYELAVELSKKFDCPEKWSYLMHVRLRHNWQRAQFQIISTPLPEGSVVGHDDRHIIICSPSSNPALWDVSVFQIFGKGSQLALQRHGWSPDRIPASRKLSSILVADGVALLRFFDETPTEQIVAIDLSDLCERWRDESHLTRLFPPADIYAFNFSTYTIKIWRIRSQVRVRTLSLPLDIRLPHGHPAGDGQFLALPGKLVEDNSPVICATNVQAGTHKYLITSTPVCPYRWFEKTAVYEGRVYGLLNRKSLHIWNSQSGEELAVIEISQTPPGMAESRLSVNFLSVSHGIIATCDSDPSSVRLLWTELNSRPPLPTLNFAKVMGAPVKVCDVHMNDNCIIVRTANCQIPQFHLSLFSLPLKGCVRDCYSESRLINLVPVNDCSLFELKITPSKILNFAENQLRIYDFM